MTVYVTKQEFRAQKSRLTRAKNSGDPLAVLAAVEKTLDEWSGKAWPDDWARWARALDDAFFAFSRLDYTQRLTVDADRFRAAFDRIHG
jgi:hypothetical protein